MVILIMVMVVLIMIKKTHFARLQRKMTNIMIFFTISLYIKFTI